ncbi:Restriction endonuclease S subunit (HsdS) [Fructobacillus cardui]|uniref:Restriction endonuclease S subunit (HsdS) n=1 Tax=Fructobacillus cardui TaxID=2893170 RepID=A0ABN9Z2P7_9LACO|nr:Restriction endonuclease S subunit (HsdS) [Fructobacillus cardui]
MNTLPALTAGILNQGLNNYVPEAGATVFKNVISVSANGANTGAMFYQTHPFTVLQDAYVIDLIDESKPSDMVYLYLVGALQKSIRFNFSWTNKAGWERIKGEKITLPVDKNGLLAFDYMEAYIKELEAYLIATGLNNYVLNDEEKRVLNKFRAHNAEQSRAEQSRAEQSRAEQSRAEQSRAEQSRAVRLNNDSNNSNSDIFWTEYRLDYLFDNIVQGKRLRKDDQVKGNLPFVMSGTTNTGISKFIGNDVRQFPANSITIDIFGSAFYRPYKYGMGDDTGAYWNEKVSVDKMTMLFYTASINKSLYGIYDYGRKLRSTRAKSLVIQLPKKIESREPDYRLMSIYIRAIEKLVIRGVVNWKDKQIEATRDVVNSD